MRRGRLLTKPCLASNQSNQSNHSNHHGTSRKYPSLAESRIRNETIPALPHSAVSYQKTVASLPIDSKNSATYSAEPPNTAFATAYDNPTPSARTSAGNISALISPLIDV